MLKPRYEPTWDTEDDNSELIAHVGPLDIYHEYNYEGNGEHWILVVGPGKRCRDPENRSDNFDVYKVEGNNLVPMEGNFGVVQDIHIELAEMCEIYALCVACELIKES